MILFSVLPACTSEAKQLTIFGGARMPGGQMMDLYVLDRRILAVRQVGPRPAGARVIDLRGKYIAPAFIDSHVHLVYRPDVTGMAKGGVTAAVDHAAPVAFFAKSFRPLAVIGSGPMITAVDGYPTQGWGSNGYGWEVADPAEAIEAVDALFGLGAGLIKLPVTSGPTLAAGAQAVVVERAHQHGLKVSTHALGAEEATAAAIAGADVLAHTPVAALDDDAVIAWSQRAVISSLRAFGGSQTAVDNLQKLNEAGALVLYGTDFGNTTTAGIDGVEIGLMQAAGMTAAEILEAGTSAPAAFWGFDDLGKLAPGYWASVLVLDADPLEDPMTLASPDKVWLFGNRVK